MTREEKQKLCDEFIDKIEQQFIDFQKETNIMFSIFSNYEFENLNRLFPHHELVCKKKYHDFYYLPATKIDTGHSFDYQYVYGPNESFTSVPNERGKI